MIVDVTEPFWYLVEVGRCDDLDESEAYGFIANVPSDHLLGVQVGSLFPVDDLPKQVRVRDGMFVFCSLLEALYGMHDVISSNDLNGYNAKLQTNIEEIARFVESLVDELDFSKLTVGYT